LLGLPDNLATLNHEAAIAFGGSFIVWVFAEFKQSEELSARNVSENDKRGARKILSLHQGYMRDFLIHHDMWQYFDEKIYRDITDLMNRYERDALFFHNRKLKVKLAPFFEELRTLCDYIAIETTPEKIGGCWRIGFKPPENVPDEEYNNRRRKADHANKLATNSWIYLDELAKLIREKMPAAIG